MKYFQLLKLNRLILQRRNYCYCCPPCYKPKHLICFKQWTSDMVKEILASALNLKSSCPNTQMKRLDVLQDCKVTILQEVNEPVLNLAVSKAASLLGAYDVTITDSLVWEKDYNGRILSSMCDVIFVSTATHMCVQRFANQAQVPVVCMRSRTHASIQALSTIMSIVEEVGTMQNLTVSYIGAPHPVLNSYLLLCPMLGAHIKFKCCCDKCPVSPLLKKSSEQMVKDTNTISKQCTCTDDVLNSCSVVIAGPTPKDKENVSKFKVSADKINKSTQCNWIFFHTTPRGDEVDDDLFNHCNARTFKAFENMQYIAASLMANTIRGHLF